MPFGKLDDDDDDDADVDDGDVHVDGDADDDGTHSWHLYTYHPSHSFHPSRASCFRCFSRELSFFAFTFAYLTGSVSGSVCGCGQG